MTCFWATIDKQKTPKRSRQVAQILLNLDNNCFILIYFNILTTLQQQTEGMNMDYA